MKKLIAGVCFLVLFAACQPVANENMTNANKTPETKAVAPPSEADMIAKEKAAWDAFKRKDADAFKKTAAPEYTEITGNGVRDLAATVANMNDVNLTDVTFADWKMTTIDKDLLLLTYTTTQKGTYKGESFDGPYRHAAAWINRNGEWLAIYFQEVMSMPTPAAPTPAPTRQETKPPASPMATPGDAGPDPAANERLVWDALKAKNYDAFASYLADDAVQITPDGLYDKTGSVKGVQTFDASKAQLGDWKAVKFDEEASLVTYTVKSPGMKPEIEYHSTIWAKRDGKWQAVFHIGTPAGQMAHPTPGASPSPTKKM
jgi:hypothetical protein